MFNLSAKPPSPRRSPILYHNPDNPIGYLGIHPKSLKQNTFGFREGVMNSQKTYAIEKTCYVSYLGSEGKMMILTYFNNEDLSIPMYSYLFAINANPVSKIS